ncbi:IclR family transcriptional regulator [Romboutsia timonensis]|uniref:IclR family transcriptional regulator n=1 Tax=Romboutsia timonensis TaxID=1776391 RepID=UPI0008DAA6BE|nr:IclR family transcriptional regulator [Romboutsia timonensis]
MNETNLVQSVDRALRIIEFLAENPTGAGITEISKSLGLSKGTVHRLISTLKERDFAYQSSNTELYRLSYKILYLYNCISNNIDMFKVSRPIIRKFADKVDATVHLATLDEKRSNIVYIDRIEPMNSQKLFVMSSRVGKKAPCYCTAAGKMLLSQYSDDEIRDIMKGEEYKTYTDKTIKNIDEFLEEIHKVRKQGYALDENEYDHGIICISIPIYNSNGKIDFTMSVTDLILYTKVEELINLKGQLDEVSRKVSNAINYI